MQESRKDMPEISIIIPVYNVERKIQRCLDSVKHQTFSDFELILVNDGSTDKSGEICDKYVANDERFKVIHQNNQGVSVARNAGINIAKGRYITFIDSDDYVNGDFLSNLYATICSSGADIAMCNYYMVFEDRTDVCMKHGYSSGNILEKDEIKSVFYKHIQDNDCTIGYFSLWNKIYRSNLIRENHIFLDTEMSFGEDMMFIMQCLKFSNKIAFIEEPLYYYEMTENGLFSRYRRSFLNDTMKCYCSLVSQLKIKEVEELLPLSLKYYGYVMQHIRGIIENESEKIALIRNVYKNKTAQEIIHNIVSNLKCKKIDKFDQQDIRLIRLLGKKRYWAATILALYQFDNNFWLRKCRYEISLFQGCMEADYNTKLKSIKWSIKTKGLFIVAPRTKILTKKTSQINIRDYFSKQLIFVLLFINPVPRLNLALSATDM